MDFYIMKYIIILIFCFSPCCWANSSFTADSINRLVVHDFGQHILVYFPSDVTNAEQCASNNGVALKKEHPLFNEMYAALLSTFHGNGRLSGWVNGCDPFFKMPLLTRVDLTK